MYTFFSFVTNIWVQNRLWIKYHFNDFETYHCRICRCATPLRQVHLPINYCDAKVPTAGGSTICLFLEISSFFPSRITTAVHASRRNISTAEDQHWHCYSPPGAEGPSCTAVTPLPAAKQAALLVGLLVQEEEEKSLAAVLRRTKHGWQYWRGSCPTEASCERAG